MLLDEIKGPNDIKKIEKEDYGILAEEIREFLSVEDIWHQILGLWN